MASKQSKFVWRRSLDSKHYVAVVVFSSQGFKARFRGLKATFWVPADKLKASAGSNGGMGTSYSEDLFCEMTRAEFDDEMWKDGKVEKDTSFRFTAKLNSSEVKHLVVEVIFPDEETVTLSLKASKEGEEFDVPAIIKKKDGTEERENFKAKIEVLKEMLCACDYTKVKQSSAFNVNARLERGKDENEQK